ncbi:MAG: tetraprenyl-beta-curcumene synthase family protein [Candidatus Eremiobacteraeota bacterium]|nr:tetraprenyl-beta-curcumene synthase family protein [Candidatus Eremiobacteraeota bacterium]
MFTEIEPAFRLVLGSRERLSFLFARGPGMFFDTIRFLRRIVPLASAALAKIRIAATTIPDDLLRAEATASVDGKSYHVAGAAVLATFLDAASARRYVDIVAPLESIYDYLDNLCDRHPNVDACAYPVLHCAIADALDPDASPRDYYEKGPTGNDGGYLRRLVEQTQNALRAAPQLDAMKPLLREAATLYAQMQTYTHLAPGARERACVLWYESHQSRFSDLDWHEFACAAGSQFQVYGPLFAAFAGESVVDAYRAYFPYVSSLHVLLDSFIDQAEDLAHRELNFAALYDGAHGLRQRLAFLATAARRRFLSMPDPARHEFVLRIMTLFYLSHPKIALQGLDREACALLRAIK